ncbi:hypothetical protein AX16_009007 [Volvariella volvacea WC 439]|nr:hypothetical protein AX16_009007 [Volvariella volvacea WC 439]
MTTPSEPRLPPELECIIFELAARSCKSEALPVLMLVARRVRDWLRPMLFEIVVVTSDRHRPLTRWPPYPTGQETHHVRRLLMHYGYYGRPPQDIPANSPDFEMFVSHCPNLQDFAVWCDTPPDLLAQLIGVLHSPHRTVAPPGFGLFRLSLYLRYLFPDRADFKDEIFRDLTHLEVLDEGHTINWEEGNNYGCLPKLKYLAFVDAPSRVEIVHKCLEGCKGLRVLIIDGVDDEDEVSHQLLLLIHTQSNCEERKEETGIEMGILHAEERRLQACKVVINPDLGHRISAGNWVDGGDEGDIMWTHAEAVDISYDAIVCLTLLGLWKRFSSASQPRLPPELERIIFELAARSRKSAALPVLMLVARRVRDWLRPMLFEVVALSSDRYQTICRWPPYPTAQETHYVKRLLIHYGGYQRPHLNTLVDPPDFKTFVSHCPNLQDFAIWRHAPDHLLDQLTAVLHSPHRTVAPPGFGLFRLSLYLKQLFPDRVDFKHEVFRDVTHLEVLDGGSAITWEEGNNYGCLPRLKYLAFTNVTILPGRTEIVTRCLEECKALKVLILVGVVDSDAVSRQLLLLRRSRSDHEEGDKEHGMGTGILRAGYGELQACKVVINPSIGNATSVEDWVNGGDEGEIMWTHAETIVQRRLEQRLKRSPLSLF